MERSPKDCYWADFFRYIESIHPGVRSYLSSFCSWETENFYDHHLSHAAGAFLPSGFERSIVLVIDGSGEDESLSVYLADRHARPVFKRVTSLKTATFSFGHSYADATRSIGYTSGSPDNHTGKMMGLSSFGRPRHLATLRSTLHAHSGLFPLMLEPESDWHVLLTQLVGENPGSLYEGFSDEQADMAASMQRFLEDEILALVSRLAGQYSDYRTLCLSGGVAQNSLMTGRILAQRIFEDIFSSPIASDTGLAYGASALGAQEALSDAKKGHFKWRTAYHGFRHNDVAGELNAIEGTYDLPIDITRDTFDPEAIADMLVNNKIVVLYQGAQEIGPRALGNRSILSLPTVEMRDKINNTIKFREPWRPFAPVLLEEALPVLFNETRPEPFMSIIYDTPYQSQAEIPGVNHFDNTTRLQTVNETQNKRLTQIIEAVAARGHPPIILNTSYNVDGQTIVRTVWDAIITALVSGVDALILDNDVVRSTLPERAPRDWISVLDRMLEEHLRTAPGLRIVSFCDGQAAKDFEAKVRGLPCFTLRKTPVLLEVLTADEFIASDPLGDENQVTLYWVGDAPWIEDEDFVFKKKFRSGFETTLFDRWPKLEARCAASTNLAKSYIIDAQDRCLPLDYYSTVLANRINAHTLMLNDDAIDVRREMQSTVDQLTAKLAQNETVLEDLREQITSVIEERDAYKGLQETVESLIVDRDAHKAALEELKSRTLMKRIRSPK